MTGPSLVIDASTYRGTVAIVQGDRVLAHGETQMRGVDEERLMPAVASLLREAGLAPRELGGIVCGEGPGSFTSLRIAASIAKGIVTATGHPLITVSSLLLVVAGTEVSLHTGRYLALLDAIRGEWFAARVSVDGDGRVTAEDGWALMNASLVQQVLRSETRVAVGPGQTIDAFPHARGVARVGGGSDVLRRVDPAVWEPAYGRLPEAQARWEQSHGRPLVA